MIVISGHRDTHFAWLQHVQAGDRLQLETHGGRFDYEVTGMQIVNAEQEHIALDEGGDASLLLVTCWPFDAVASGPLRYTVRAVPVDWEARQ